MAFSLGLAGKTEIQFLFPIAGLLIDNLDSAGSFKRPLFGDDGITCIGVETENGTKYFADKVVLAAGAWSPTLVDLEDQCCSKASSLGLAMTQLICIDAKR